VNARENHYPSDEPPTISATEFKQRCLQILDELGPEGVVVTKRGKPVARVLPAPKQDFDDLYGKYRDRIVVKGDIFTTGRRWDAQS
jgi:prevent-host-death family protein